MKYLYTNENVKLSRIAFGCSRIYGGREYKISEKLIRFALDCGITHFDTSPSYGSEAVLGEILKGEKNITFSTKFGSPNQYNKIYSEALFRQFYRLTLKRMFSYFPTSKKVLVEINNKLSFKNKKIYTEDPILKSLPTKQEVINSVEISLNNLKRDSIDLYLLHEPNLFFINEYLYEIFESLKHKKLIRSYGIGSSDFPNFKISRIPIVQVPYSSKLKLTNYHGIKIFHGFFRYYSHDSETAYTSINNFLMKDKNSIILFSASSPRLIKNAVFSI